MLSRLLLAAVAVAALTAFVRSDAGATGPAKAAPSPRPIAPLLTSAAIQTAPRSSDARPVRVVLAPLYASADGTGSAAGGKDAFIPTPGSPVGPRGASLLPAQTHARTATLAGKGVSVREGRRARRPEARVEPWPAPDASAPRPSLSRSAELPGMVLR